MRILWFPLLLGAAAPPGCATIPIEEGDLCTVASPCPLILGVSCPAGEDTAIDLDPGIMVASVVAVYQDDDVNIAEPWTSWAQVVDVLDLTCPEETVPGTGFGNVVIYGLATQ